MRYARSLGSRGTIYSYAFIKKGNDERYYRSRQYLNGRGYCILDDSLGVFGRSVAFRIPYMKAS